MLTYVSQEVLAELEEANRLHRFALVLMLERAFLAGVGAEARRN